MNEKFKGTESSSQKQEVREYPTLSIEHLSVLYAENPTPEEEKLNKAYQCIQQLYHQTMFGKYTQWFGYMSGIGFAVNQETFGLYEPQLQKIFSVLHTKLAGLEDNRERVKDIGIVRDLFLNVVDALMSFNYEKDVHSSVQNEFKESGAQEFINHTIKMFEDVIAELEADI